MEFLISMAVVFGAGAWFGYWFSARRVDAWQLIIQSLQEELDQGKGKQARSFRPTGIASGSSPGVTCMPPCDEEDYLA